MGVLQALEAIKVITAAGEDAKPPSLHIFSAYSSPLFRTIKLRSRRPNCAVCSAEASVTLETVKSGSTDYVFFCGTVSPEKLLLPEERISPLEYRAKYPLASTINPLSKKPTIIDVREKVQFDICKLENSVNIPISRILSSSTIKARENGDLTDGLTPLPPWLPADVASPDSTDPIYVVCRLGNDSQIAVKRLKELGLDRGGERVIADIRGGLRAWREQVDPEWPQY
jgi:adenylyltransferase/sulfurtransferase